MELKRDSTPLGHTMTEFEYRAFREFLEKACGIVLGENKQYLITSRMKKILSEFKLGTLGELMEEIRRERVSGLRDRVIEAMTTNETSWFRDTQPFNALKEKIFPLLGKQRKASLRIWSAACASGQEPYSIGMSLHEYQLTNPGLLSGQAEIIATDISPTMLKIADKGCYNEVSLARGMTEERRRRYFERVDEGWRVTSLIKSNIQFRELNLLQGYALLGRFDIIFCRNVLIYFSKESKKDILERMARLLNPGGFLFLGGSESVTNVTECFSMQNIAGGVVYQVK